MIRSCVSALGSIKKECYTFSCAEYISCRNDGRRLWKAKGTTLTKVCPLIQNTWWLSKQKNNGNFFQPNSGYPTHRLGSWSECFLFQLIWLQLRIINYLKRLATFSRVHQMWTVSCPMAWRRTFPREAATAAVGVIKRNSITSMITTSVTPLVGDEFSVRKGYR